MTATPTDQLPAAPTAAPVAADALARFLHRPESYGDGTSAVTVKETHISWVALTDRRVYKVKKPVRFAFLDYSTLERRLHACREELRLNARLAPDVYLGYLPITLGPDGKLRFGNGGQVVDYCVVMKRLPESRMLDRLIRDGAASATDAELLLGVLVPFYASAARGPEIDRHATAEAIERQARENIATIDATEHGLPPAMFQRVRASQLQFLNLSTAVFAERIGSGHVCEGHGDLRPEHVCMTGERPVVFDCVEFSQPLRAADVASELAFLAMECDFLRAPELGASLIRGYRRRGRDEFSEQLVAFYKSYRACVRAKVELVRAAQQGGRAARLSRMRARRYLQLASFYATAFYRPKLFVMVGAAGSGKSTVAKALAQTLGLEVLRTDIVRHELAGRREPDAAYQQGIYSDAMTARTYKALLDRAETLLRESVSVVLDGTFRSPQNRAAAAELAREHGADVHFVYCRCPPETAHARIAGRMSRGDAASDARPELYDLQQAELDSTGDWTDLPVVVVHTTKPPAASVATVLAALRHPPAPAASLR